MKYKYSVDVLTLSKSNPKKNVAQVLLELIKKRTKKGKNLFLNADYKTIESLSDKLFSTQAKDEIVEIYTPVFKVLNPLILPLSVIETRCVINITNVDAKEFVIHSSLVDEKLKRIPSLRNLLFIIPEENRSKLNSQDIYIAITEIHKFVKPVLNIIVVSLDDKFTILSSKNIFAVDTIYSNIFYKSDIMDIFQNDKIKIPLLNQIKVKQHY